jgi:dipeptidyl-peptidase 4
MKLLVNLLIVVFCTVQAILCQNFTVEDVEIGLYTKFKPDNLSNIYWRNDSSVIYVHNDSLFEFNLYGNSEDLILSLDELNTGLNKKDLESLKKFPAFQSVSTDEFYFYRDSIIIVYDFLNKEVERTVFLPGKAENINYCKDCMKVAYSLSGNLFIDDSKGNKTQLTFDSIDGIVNGEIVHRNEFNIKNGSFWSPECSMIAFYRKNESMVSRYPLVNTQLRVADVNWIRYPMAGMKSEEVEVLVYNFENDSIIRLHTTGDPEHYLTNITWSPDGKYIYIQELNRGQDSMNLNKYDAHSGEKAETLFEETSDKYVEPHAKIVFDLTDKSSFFYESDRDGYNHIYKYDAAKGKLVKLTKGNWEVLEYYGYDKENGWLYYSSTEKSPLESHLYKLNVDNGKNERLTKEDGYHFIKFNNDLNAFVDYYSALDIPRKIEVNTVDRKIHSVLLEAGNPLKGYNLGERIISTIKAADGKTDLYYKIVKPVDFDPNKKYPVIMYVYGGPHVQLITNSWLGRTEMWMHYMAQNGYIGFTIDPRGSDNRGMKFEDVIYRNLGIPEIEDYRKAVDFLASLGYADTSRIGVHGWSFGGCMTTSLMLHYPEIFKVGVAGGPVIDWKFYEVMYTERYMDTPQENPEGYQKTDLNNYAGNLKGHLLIIQGGQDPVVVPQHSMSFLRSCIIKNKQMEFFMYPTHKHNVTGIDRVNLTTKVSDYFFRNL